VDRSSDIESAGMIIAASSGDFDLSELLLQPAIKMIHNREVPIICFTINV